MTVLFGCKALKQTVDTISKVQRSIELTIVNGKAETAINLCSFAEQEK